MENEEIRISEQFYVELKLVSRRLSKLQEQMRKYHELGFESNGEIQVNDQVYWTFMKINHGLVTI